MPGFRRHRERGCDQAERRDAVVVEAERDERAERVADGDEWNARHAGGEFVEGGDRVEPLAGAAGELGPEVEPQCGDAGGRERGEHCRTTLLNRLPPYCG